MDNSKIITQEILDSHPEWKESGLVVGDLIPYFNPEVPSSEELVDHVVTQEDVDSNPEFANHGINIGDTIQILKSETTIGKDDITNDQKESDKSEIPSEVIIAETSKLRFNGQIVISEGYRTVGNQTFRHIKIADGSSYDITEEEYRAKVKMSYSPIN